MSFKQQGRGSFRSSFNYCEVTFDMWSIVGINCPTPKNANMYIISGMFI